LKPFTSQQREKIIMKQASAILLPTVLLILGIVAAGRHGALAQPLSYELPRETAVLRPGPNIEAAQSNCTGCHSVDYIQTQPRGPKFKKEFWTAEVTKMIKVYGAPIADSDVEKIVDYLAATY
jgi:hypothetical protein